MQSFRFSDAQIEAGISKHEASVPECGAPTAEALSRWENEGGAPDRRGESGNRKVPDEALLLPIARSAENVVERHQDGSTVDPKC